MAEILEIILLFLLMFVTVFFIVLCVQVFFLIKDLRQTLSKANKVLDNTGSITDSMTEPISAISDLVDSLSTGTVIAKILKVAMKSFIKTEKRSRKGDEEDE